jgi:hypothetical protein
MIFEENNFKGSHSKKSIFRHKVLNLLPNEFCGFPYFRVIGVP